jgi:hypothetical protein
MGDLMGWGDPAGWYRQVPAGVMVTVLWKDVLNV